MLSLLPQINVYETRKAAREVLSEYRKLERLSGKDYSISLVPTLSDMPRGGNQEHSKIETMVQKKVDANRVTMEILYAVNRIRTIYKEILYFKYMDRERYSNIQIAEMLNLSERDFERKLSEGLIEFAEAYLNGSLLKY